MPKLPSFEELFGVEIAGFQKAYLYLDVEFPDEVPDYTEDMGLIKKVAREMVAKQDGVKDV